MKKKEQNKIEMVHIKKKKLKLTTYDLVDSFVRLSEDIQLISFVCIT